MPENPNIPPGFPDRLRDLMHQQRLNTVDLEKKSGVDNSAIGRYRNGKRAPRPVELMKIATALGTSVSYLLDGVDSKALEPVTKASDKELPAEAKKALDDYPWPANVDLDRVAQISRGLADEAFAHRGTHIPVSIWSDRIRQQLAAQKGKRIESAREAPDQSAEDPDVSAHKATKKTAAKTRRKSG